MSKNNTQGQIIGPDIWERIKREAKYKKISPQVLLNQILRQALFNDGKKKKVSTNHKNKLDECPHCHKSLHERGKKKETSPTKGFFSRFF